MNIANKNTHCFTILIFLMLLPLQLIQAEPLFSPGKNLTQKEENWQQFELSSSQIRSRVEHRLINLLLGHTVDQYLDFAADDGVAKKSTKRLKLRLNEHHIVLLYQRSFE